MQRFGDSEKSLLEKGGRMLKEIASNLDSGQADLLLAAFQRLNVWGFESQLPPVRLTWNTRLRSSAGRFVSGAAPWRDAGTRGLVPERYHPRIEIASYLLQHERSVELIVDTLAHEMVHFWLWIRKKPFGHTDLFHRKLKELGASRYNTVPLRRNYKYVYECPRCLGKYPTRRRLANVACLKCCRLFASGRFDSRFRLLLLGAYSEELLQGQTSGGSETGK